MLDEIQWLGVDAVWLMPISPSPSEHKYDVTDYYSVDESYGTLDDFWLLTRECHSRDMKVIVDLVMNHTSSEHSWFVSSANDPQGQHAHYYSWRDCPPTDLSEEMLSRWHRHANGRYYYGYFWSGMPDLNYDNPLVRDEMKRVAAFWIEQGVDGFRLDAARHIYNPGEGFCPDQQTAQTSNIAWWSEFKTFCEHHNPRLTLTAEVWDTPEVRTAYATVFDSLFHFDLGGDPDAQVFSLISGKLDPNAWASSMQEYYSTLRRKAPNCSDVPFICNHDMDRAASILEGIDQLKLSASIYLTLPGIPQVYYGEEIGMSGHRTATDKHDNNRRTPMLWGEDCPGHTSWIASPDNNGTKPFSEQKKDPDSLLNHYRQLIRLRRSTPSLSWGTFEAVETGSMNLLAYQRKTPEETALVLHRVGPGPIEIDAYKNFGKVVFKSGCYKDGSASQVGSLIQVSLETDTAALRSPERRNEADG